MIKKLVFFVSAALTLVLFLISGGCYSGATDVDISGKKIDSKILVQLEAGKATKREVIKTFGASHGSVKKDEDIEILSYSYCKRTSISSSFPLLWSTNDKKEEKETTYFKFQDGVLIEFWKSIE